MRKCHELVLIFEEVLSHAIATWICVQRAALICERLHQGAWPQPLPTRSTSRKGPQSRPQGFPWSHAGSHL